MQLPFLKSSRAAQGLREDWLTLGDSLVKLRLARHPRARRYLLRACPDGTARVTVPRAGSFREALIFAQRHADWLKRQFERLARAPRAPESWFHGTEILFRGTPVRLEVDDSRRVARVSDQEIPLSHFGKGEDLRPLTERHLRKLAATELSSRARQLATLHGFSLNRVSVRNQRSRWGSCSRRGTVSLNWRLIQAPHEVRDYLIYHELAHLRHMNHSSHFWAEVARLCPDYMSAEKWLRQHSRLLRRG